VIQTHGAAIQSRVTTEDPAKDFQPDTGEISIFIFVFSCGIVVNYFPCFKAVLKSTDRARAWASGMFVKLVFRISGSGSSILLQSDPDQYPDTAIITLKFDFTVFLLLF
jgi:hypothetical protein